MPDPSAVSLKPESMAFDTLDYLHFLIGVAWLAAITSGVIAIAGHRFLARRMVNRATTIPRRFLVHVMMALAALAPAAVFAWVLAIAWLELTHDYFAVVRIGYYQLATVPSILGFYFLVQAQKRHPHRGVRPPIGLAILLMIPAPICAYASFIAPHRLVTERTDVPMPRIAADAKPIRIAVIADLQAAEITDYERGAIDRVLAEKPDLILMPGDLFQCSWRQWEKGEASFRPEMQRLACPFGTFAVMGDVDDYDDLSALLANTPVKLLRNDIAVIEVRGTRVAIGGVELLPNTPNSDATIRRLAATDCDVRVLLGHRPDAVFEIKNGESIDLVVAGHTHGGQVVIPGFGPPITLTGIPRAAAAGGLHEVNGHRIYVSRGVGCERGSAPPIRLFCPPELSILTLTGQAH